MQSNQGLLEYTEKESVPLKTQLFVDRDRLCLQREKFVIRHRMYFIRQGAGCQIPRQEIYCVDSKTGKVIKYKEFN
jgi:hypothetical protein